MTIKAIETRYKGYRFRSRLEARWAVFFDALGHKWVYEKEGFDIDGLWYLPDFWLPWANCWFEVKGDEPSEEDMKKIVGMQQNSNAIILAVGDIGSHLLTGYVTDIGDSSCGFSDWECSFKFCDECNKWTFDFSTNKQILTGFGGKDVGCGHHSYHNSELVSPEPLADLYETAIEVARSFRF